MFNNLSILRRARVASALSLATLLSVGIWSPTQAAPDLVPPVRGEVDRNRRNDRVRGDTLRGTVDRVYSARSFDLRTNEGRIYRVNIRVSVGLETRTNVRVMGDLNGSTFDARAITVGDFGDDRYDDGYNNGGYGNNGGTGNNDGYGNNGGTGNNGATGNNDGYGNNGGTNNGQYQGQNVVLRGRVVRFISRTDIEVRDDDDGRIYRVQTNRAVPYSIREGDRIEARGELNGNTIRAELTSETGGSVGNNGNNGNNRGDAVFVNFSGPILSLDLNREEASVRADNGYTYTLRARRATLDNFRVGQRVRVQGNWINERVEVTQLTRE